MWTISELTYFRTDPLPKWSIFEVTDFEISK